MRNHAAIQNHDYADPAVFFADESGRMVIAFFDPAFVRADVIVIDRADHSVHAVLHESCHLIGHISPEMAEDMLREGEILLAALHVRGHVVDLIAPVCEAAAQASRCKK